jgi:hypothetical protein
VAVPLSSGFDGIVRRQQPERKTDMTTKDKVARRKLSLLELSNVGRACKMMGYSRQQFYEIRHNFQTYGAEGLLDRLSGERDLALEQRRPLPPEQIRAFSDG